VTPNAIEIHSDQDINSIMKNMANKQRIKDTRPNMKSILFVDDALVLRKDEEQIEGNLHECYLTVRERRLRVDMDSRVSGEILKK
jgi:hypothetical protein